MKNHSSAGGVPKMKLVTSQMQVSCKPEALQVITIMQFSVIYVLQIATSPQSVHPLQDTQGTSLECEAQRFHSASVITLQLGKAWHCYVRNGSTEMKWKKLRGQYTELSSVTANTLHQLCEQDSVPSGVV